MAVNAYTTRRAILKAATVAPALAALSTVAATAAEVQPEVDRSTIEAYYTFLWLEMTAIGRRYGIAFDDVIKEKHRPSARAFSQHTTLANRIRALGFA